MVRFLSEIVGSAAAQALGYNETYRHEKGDTIDIEYTGPMNKQRLLKGEFKPRVAVANVTTYIAVRDWSVTFYFRGRVLGEGPTVTAVGIKGWPANKDALRYMTDKISETLSIAAEHPQFGEKTRRIAQQMFTDKVRFLEDNPGYRDMPSLGAAAKKVYASQTEV